MRISNLFQFVRLIVLSLFFPVLVLGEYHALGQDMTGYVDISYQASLPITPENVDQIVELAAYEQSTVCTAAFSPNRDLLASSGVGTIVLRDIADDVVLNTLTTGHASVRSIAFSRDGALIAATSTDNCGQTNVQMWAAASGTLLLQRLDDFEHMATGVAFSPDGAMLAAGTGCAFDMAGSASAKVWDIESGALLVDIPAPSFVADVAFSPDGNVLAAASGDGIIRLWDVATGTLHRELHGHVGAVLSIAFSPDGSRLASGGTDARLWDVASGDNLYVFESPVSEVVDVTFSADSQLVAVGGGSQTLAFYDAATGMELAVREVGVESDYIYSVAFNADSTLLATCEHDQMLRLWGVQEQ